MQRGDWSGSMISCFLRVDGSCLHTDAIAAAAYKLALHRHEASGSVKKRARMG